MLPTILEAVKLAGANAPAFQALFDAAVATLGADDQAAAQDAYARAMEGSDAAHEDLQGQS
jgi:hypothetical protein